MPTIVPISLSGQVRFDSQRWFPDLQLFAFSRGSSAYTIGRIPFNLSRLRRLIGLSNLAQTSSRTLAEST
jgi:hypothetical protein